MRLSFLYVLLLFPFMGCYSQKERCYNLHSKISSNDLELQLSVFHDNSNGLLFQLFDQSLLIDEICIPNVDVLEKYEMKKIEFYEDESNKVYIIEMAIFGSTFGANKFLIIWNKENEWNLSKSFFPKAVITDLNGDGLMEFQVVAGVDNGKIFKFRKGNFNLVKYPPSLNPNSKK